MKGISRETMSRLIKDFRIRERMEKFKEDNREKIELITEARYLIIIMGGITYLILTIIPIRIVLTVVIILLSMQKLVVQLKNKVIEDGLITYFPDSLKHTFLNRSVLDILCDLWFIPSMSVYFTAAIKPMFDQSISPEEVTK